MVTLEKSVFLEGVGLHSGELARVDVRPGKAGVRLLKNGVEVLLSPHAVSHTRRCTVVGEGNSAVSTIEHLFSALHGLGITQVDIHVNGSELPILDGSSAPWVAAFDKAGLKAVPPTEPLRVQTKTRVELGSSWVTAESSDVLDITVEVDFPDTPLSPQLVREVITPEIYRTRIAPARTFVLQRDIDGLRAAGLIKGGSLECAVVLNDAGQPTNTPLLFSDELARHKLLDVLGDLFTAGRPVVGKFHFYRPGHGVNNALMRQLVGG